MAVNRKEKTPGQLQRQTTKTSDADTQGHRNVQVYQLAYNLAMEVFRESKAFPKEEAFSLIDQIRRSSRSVAANVAEAFRKRQYPNMFVNKLVESDAKVTETQVWVDFACDCDYLSSERRDDFIKRYEAIGKILGGMIAESR